MASDIDLTSKYNNFLTPPGGFVIWVFILCELLGFGIGLIMFAFEQNSMPEVFKASKSNLNQLYGTLNTIILITSGFLVALASKAHQSNFKQKTIKLLLGATTLGITFLVLKGLEYDEKLNLGISLGHSTFFDYYWLLTAFHALHVLLGVFILIILIYKTHTDSPYAEEDFNFETGCMFWHMCDIIWVLVFPIIYLI